MYNCTTFLSKGGWNWSYILTYCLYHSLVCYCQNFWVKTTNISVFLKLLFNLVYCGFFIVIILLGVGESEAVLWQRLSCPYEPEHRVLQRVWCRKTSAVCCTGLTFSHSAQLVDGGKLQVTQDTQAFTVEVLKSEHTGVYWCGVLGRNNTLIRLAEGNFHSCKYRRCNIWWLFHFISLNIKLASAH